MRSIHNGGERSDQAIGFIMILFGSAESGHSYKVRLFLLLAQIEHEYRCVDLDIPREARPADFRAASKFGEVPVVVLDNTSYCQSNAILIALAERFGKMLGHPNERHLVLEWLSWETNRVGFSVPNLRHALRWEPQPESVLKFLRERANVDLKTLNDSLAQSDFLVPSGLTIADLSCAGYLYWIEQAGLSLVEFPNVQHWLRSIAAVNGWQSPSEAMQPQ